MWMYVSICVSFALSLNPFLMFVFSYSNLFVLGFILFYHYYLDDCFLMRDREGVDSYGGREDFKGIGRGEAVINTSYEKNLFFSFFLVLVLLFFQDRLSLYNSPSCPGTSFATRLVSNSWKICLPLPPKC